MSILLEAEHLTKIFTQRGKNPFKAVNDVSFTLKKGETLGIVGESGSGKSTIAKLLTRLTDITEGTLKFEGKDITRLKQSQLKEVYGDIQWDSYPFELSGGMNQRAGIAIAMLMNPPILFADEPTSALDVSVQRQVVREMLKLRELFGTAIVIVTHDIGVVRAMADTVLVLKNGKTVEYGTADRVLDHPRDPYTRKLLEAVPKLQRKVRV